MNIGKNILLGLVLALLTGFSVYSAFDPDRPHRNKLRHSSASADSLKTDPWIVEVIPPGGSLYGIMEKNDIPLREIATLTFQFGDFIDVTTIQPGDTLKIKLSPSKDRIEAMSFIQEPTLRHQFIVRGDSLIYTEERLPVQEETKLLSGTLEGTLSASLAKLGLPNRDAQQIINALEAKINFRRDAKAEDEFQVLAELRYFEGKLIPGGKVLYVNYSGKKAGKHELFRYEDPNPKSVLTGLYGPDGKIVRSTSGGGVGYPLGSIHVRSKFGRRVDPVYGHWAMHQGVDYKASHGTPVMAVANGTVTESGYSGGWGNQVRIKHPSGLTSQYAHLSSIAVKRGQSVKRGQVIGRVGSTGKSTGPHLHFGLMKGSQWINPTNLKMVGAEQLTVIQLKDFTRQRDLIKAQLQQYLNPGPPAVETARR